MKLFLVGLSTWKGKIGESTPLVADLVGVAKVGKGETNGRESCSWPAEAQMPSWLRSCEPPRCLSNQS